MNQKYKKFGVIVIISLVVIVLLTFVANYIIERKIEKALANLPETVKVDYSTLDVSVWRGKIHLHAPTVVITGETTSKSILNAKLKIIEINDVSYWDFLVNNKVSVENLTVNELVVKYLHNPLVKNDDYNSSFMESIKQVINVENIKINNADILIADFDTDSTLLSIPKLNFELLNLQIDPNVSEEKKAIMYDDFVFNAEHLKWATNAYDDLFLDAIDMSNAELKIDGLKLKTKYNRAKFSTLLKKERDHFDVTIKEVKVLDLDFGFNPNNQFYFTSKKVNLDAPNAEIYRDKLIADDLSIKSLYGTMLRNLDFNLGLNTIEIVDGSISYLEKVNIDEIAGRLDFSNMNARITNLGNTFGDDDTVIHVNATFMKTSPLEVHWNFKVADTTDQFVFKADIGKLPAPDLNPFSKPNLKVLLEGELLRTYATISGDVNTSRVNMRTDYEDFKVNILDKEGKKKKKVLSAIANIFIKKSSDQTSDGFRESFKDHIERDKTKSIFNFIWLNLKAGLASVLTGNGKK